MKQRCLNPSSPKYHRYGGRGITVDLRWHDFENFAEDMGEMPEGATLDRIDNDGPYCKANCRWATYKEQGNNRSTNVWLTHGGETLTAAQWSERLGGAKSLVQLRLSRLKWSVARAVTTPPQSRGVHA